MAGSPFPNLLRQAQALADQDVARKAELVRNRIIVQLSQPGRGRLYARGPYRVHRASAPGQSPAVDTGQLRQRIAVNKVTQGHYRVGTNLFYAFTLEFGTRRIAARPFMRPALAAVRGTP